MSQLLYGKSPHFPVLVLYLYGRVMVLPRLINLSIPGMEGLGRFSSLKEDCAENFIPGLPAE